MNWATATKWRFQGFAIIMTFMCPALFLWNAAETQREIASISWPSVPGEVQGINAKTYVDPDKNSTSYYGRVTYNYRVEGKEYSTDLTDLGPGAKWPDRQAALADVRDFRPGMQITVYYDPNDPGIGVIEKGVPTPHLIALILLTIGTIVGATVSFFTVRQWIRGYREYQLKRRASSQIGELADGAPALTQESQLGEHIDVFTPKLDNIIAGFILSGLLLVGGLAAIGFPLHGAYLANWDLPFECKVGWCWLAVGGLSLLGVGLVAGGGVLGAYSRGLISHRVDLYTNGFRYSSRRSAANVLWVDVGRIQVFREAGYTVVTKSGKEYGFDGNSIRRIKCFVEILREQARLLSLPWVTVDIDG